MNLGTISYVPPHGKLHSDAFMENLRKFKTRYPVYLISDDTKWLVSRKIDNPEHVGKRPVYALNNYLFLKALELARDAKLDAFLYIESDSRVGKDGWDGVMFDEFDRCNPKVCCAGTPIVWDMACAGLGFAKEIMDAAEQYRFLSHIPMLFFGSKHPMDCSGACYYPNGSLAIYRTEPMLAMFNGLGVGNLVEYAKRIPPYDLAVGRGLWNYHGPRCIDYVGWLTSSYSGFGDCFIDYEARKNMLRSGLRVAVHQVKDGWTP